MEKKGKRTVDPLDRARPPSVRIKRYTVWPRRQHLIVSNQSGEDFRSVYTHWSVDAKRQVLCYRDTGVDCPLCDTPRRHYLYGEAWAWSGPEFRSASQVEGSRLMEQKKIYSPLWRPVALELPDSGEELLSYLQRGTAVLLSRKNDRDNGMILWQRISCDFSVPDIPHDWLQGFLEFFYLSNKREVAVNDECLE